MEGGRTPGLCQGRRVIGVPTVGAAMNDPYAELEGIWARFVDDDRSNTENDILALLSGEGIRVRQDDGELKQLTVSRPTSAENALVIGYDT
jgi:hypothetical protein